MPYIHFFPKKETHHILHAFYGLNQIIPYLDYRQSKHHLIQTT